MITFLRLLCSVEQRSSMKILFQVFFFFVNATKYQKNNKKKTLMAIFVRFNFIVKLFDFCLHSLFNFLDMKTCIK